MAKFTQVFLCLGLFTVGSIALGDRVQFFGNTNEADYQTKMVSTEQNGLASVEVSFALSGLDLDRDADGFQKITVKGLSPIGQAGRPATYTKGSLIAVPNGYRAELEIVDEQTTRVENTLIAPFQKRYRCSAQSEFAFDSALYRSNATFPSQNVALKSVGSLRDLELVRLSVNPVQMDMKSQTLVVTTRLKVRVHLKRTNRLAKPNELPMSLYQMVTQAVSNGRYLEGSVRPTRGAELMLVFVADDFKDNADIAKLVAWHRAKGLKVNTLTLTEAGGSKDAIKDHIQELYDSANDKPVYLLFVGNGDTMPPFMASTGSGPAASDYPFSLLSGDDVVPDVLYGRIVADNAEEVKIQVRRLMNYERTPETDGQWYPRALTIASDEGWGTTDKEYAEQVAKILKDHTYQEVNPFLEGEDTATAENIIEALDDGRSWLSYFGHGDGEAWGSTNDEFSVDTIPTVNNPERMPIIIDVACTNASYVKIEMPFGKKWVTHERDGKDAGALAFYGGSVVISWHPPAIMSVGVSKYHFEQPVHTLGGSVLGGQLYLIEEKGTDSDVVDNLKWYNLFGDPSILIRTDVPKAYKVKHQLRKDASGMRMSVTANSETGDAMSGLRVSLTHKSNPIAVALTNEEGKATLDLGGVGQLEPNTMLTVTGYNVETQEIEVGAR